MADEVELTDEEKEVARILYCEVYVNVIGNSITTNAIAREKARMAVVNYKEDIELLNIKKQF